jgi:hypothetical protein
VAPRWEKIGIILFCPPEKRENVKFYCKSTVPFYFSSARWESLRTILTRWWQNRDRFRYGHQGRTQGGCTGCTCIPPSLAWKTGYEGGGGGKAAKNVHPPGKILGTPLYMGTFALLKQQISITDCHLRAKENNLSFTVCRKQTEVCRFRKFRFPYIHIY